MKPGIHTTEFLITVLTIIGMLAASIEGSLPDKWAAVVTSVSVAAYSLSRGLAKLNKPGA
jgi:hypothetical protein